MTALRLCGDEVVREAERVNARWIVRLAESVIPLDQAEAEGIGHATDRAGDLAYAARALGAASIVADRFKLQGWHSRLVEFLEFELAAVALSLDDIGIGL